MDRALGGGRWELAPTIVVARNLCWGRTDSRGAEIETPKASRGRECGGGVPLPSRLEVWGSVVSSPRGVTGSALTGGAPAENEFSGYLDFRA